MRNLFQKTVWSHYNTANIPPRFQLLYTLVMPFKYFLIGTYGLGSIGARISSIDLIFGEIYGDIWSVALMIAGYGAMLGIAFYARLVRMELVALAFMITLMLAYVGCIVTASIAGAETFRTLSLLLVLVFLPMPMWRTLDIVRELRPARHV